MVVWVISPVDCQRQVFYGFMSTEASTNLHWPRLVTPPLRTCDIIIVFEHNNLVGKYMFQCQRLQSGRVVTTLGSSGVIE